MFVLDDAPCEAEILRSQLHHSWLKNELLILRPQYLARMHNTQSPERASFEEKITPAGKFSQRIQDARRFCETLVDGFSPAQLLETGALSSLPSDVRASMRQVLHDG